MSASNAGKINGLSECTVLRAVRKSGHEEKCARFCTEDTKTLIREMFSKGKSVEEIGAAIGKSADLCRDHLKKMGVFKEKTLKERQMSVDVWTCSRCDIEKEVKEFDYNRGATSVCKKCADTYNAQLRKKNKQQHKVATALFKKKLRDVVDLAKSKPCVDCGCQYESYIMEFDHTGHKTLEVSAMVARHYSISRILEEIAKCELVCVLCHRARTFSRGQHRSSGARNSIRPEGISQYLKREELGKWLADYKASFPCLDCGGCFASFQMDFDHRPGVIKKGSVGKCFGSRKALEEEIAKCDLVCVICHKRRTFTRETADRNLQNKEPL